MALMWRYVVLFAGALVTSSVSATSLTNAALGKPVQEYASFSDPANAVDGNRNPMHVGGSCSHSKEGSPITWWMVDLLYQYVVHWVAITNRAASSERLSNFVIYVSESNPVPIPSPDGNLTGQICLNQSEALPAAITTSLSCDNILIGRYVYIYKPDAGVLNFCEFEVMARRTNPSEPVLALWPGRRTSTEIALIHSEVLESVWSLACAWVCLSQEDGMATAIQFQKSTGRCDCIARSGLAASISLTTSDPDWILMELTET